MRYNKNITTYQRMGNNYEQQPSNRLRRHCHGATRLYNRADRKSSRQYAI